MKSRPCFLLILSGLALLLAAGLLTGLARIGWRLPVSLRADWHGPVMIGGVLGSLIGIERALAGPRWALAAPLLSAAGAIGLLCGLPIGWGGGCFGAAALIQMLLLWRQRPSAGSRLLPLAGLGCWLTGTLLWMLGRPYPQLALWWAGLLLLTIVGSRAAKMPRRLGWSALAPTAATAGYGAGLGLALAWQGPGLALAGLSLSVFAGWLLARDPACRRLGAGAGERLTAICLSCGYGWLGFGGLMLMLRREQALTGFSYDMTLHSLFVGFVFSLILGHLPQLLPRLLGKGPVHHAGLYLPVGLLQLSLALRLAGGWRFDAGLRAWGGLLNVIAALGYVLLVLILLRAQTPQTK